MGRIQIHYVATSDRQELVFQQAVGFPKPIMSGKELVKC